MIAVLWVGSESGETAYQGLSVPISPRQRAEPHPGIYRDVTG